MRISDWSSDVCSSDLKRNLRRAPTFVRHQQEKKMAGESTHGEKGHSGGMSMYVRFMAMIGTSTAVMFGLMYLNTYSIDNVFWSETRFWRSEERRVGKEGVSTGRFRGSATN